MDAAMLRATRGVMDETLASVANDLQISVPELRAAELNGENAREILDEAIKLDEFVVDRENAILWLPGRIAHPRVGRVIAGGRAAVGMTQKMLAASSGVSLRTLTNIEDDDPPYPNPATLDAIAEVLSRRGVRIGRDADRYGFQFSDIEQVVPTGSAFFPETLEMERKRAIEETFMGDPKRPSLQQIRVEVEGSEPLIWRELLVPENIGMRDLDKALRVAFGWRDAGYKFECGVTVEEAYPDVPGLSSTSIDARFVTLGHFHGVPEILYRYEARASFGHRVKLGRFRPAGDGELRPVVIDGERAGPVELSGGVESYNELAKQIRMDDLPRDMGDWLAKMRYGREFDPDAFDIDAVNAKLAVQDWRIAQTRFAEIQKWSAVTIAGGPFAEPPIPVRELVIPGGAVRFVGIEPWGLSAYEKDGYGGAMDLGLISLLAPKLGRYVSGRSHVGELLTLLSYADDVESFEEFPVAVRLEGGRYDFLAIDLKVKFVGGEEIYLHVVSSDEQLEHDQVALEMAKLEIPLKVITTGCMNEALFSNLREVDRFRDRPFEGRRGQARDTQEFYDLLGSLAKKRLTVQQAIDALLASGMSPEQQGWQGGMPEVRFEGRILAAVVDKRVAIDWNSPTIRASRLAVMSNKKHSVALRPIIESYDLETFAAA